MIEDPWNPKESEIREWAFSDEPWPEQDWEIAVNDGENDSLLIELACVNECPKRKFFVHAIYFMAGDAVYSNASKERITLLINLITSVETGGDEIIKKWKTEALELLTGKRKFEYDYWCDHMFCK